MAVTGGGHAIAGTVVCCAIAALGVSAGAKSLYVIKDLNDQGPIQAYGIQSAPPYLWLQGQSGPTEYGAVGIAIDEPSATLIVTVEYLGAFYLVDALTLQVLGQVPTQGPGNLGGIAVDSARRRVYAADRNTKRLYVYAWHPEAGALAGALTRVEGEVVSLPRLSPYVDPFPLGLAFDGATGHLFVADCANARVWCFDPATWSVVEEHSFAVSQAPMGIAVDSTRRLVYTGNAFSPSVPAGYPYPERYPSLLIQRDLAAGAERSVNLRALTRDPDDCVVGIAVDEGTGLVYITTGNERWGGTSCMMVFSRDLELLGSTPNLGNPTGLCVPVTNISYSGGNRRPKAIAGAGQTREQTNHAGASVTLDGSASYDLDGDPLTYRWSWPGGSAAGARPVVAVPQGATTITLVVNDGTADSEPDTTTVTVVDTTPPGFLGVPGPITAEQTSRDGTAVAIGQAVAADVCDAAPAVANDAPALFPLGETLVTWTATDAAGNVAAAVQKVTVVDTTPPKVASLWAAPSTLWPPDARMVEVLVEAQVEDACDAAAAYRITSVASSEPVSGKGAGNTAPDWEITGDHTVRLRAERLGTNLGRVYTLTVQATDAAGNTLTAQLSVTVAHDQGTRSGRK